MSAEQARSEPASLTERLVRSIAAGGPISLAQYMAQANAHYYATRDPLGARGDFITAPEISQMFGEMIGLCLADFWLRSQRGGSWAYVELGPGRGTLAADALRAMNQARLSPEVHFVETSPVLRAAQEKSVPHARYHHDLSTLPEDRPLLVVANEFFDALPIAQAVKTGAGWREMMVGLGKDSALAPVAGERPVDARVPEALRHAEAGSIHESCAAGSAIMHELAARIARQGGGAIIIDYGYSGPALGDTLQALCNHQYTNVFDAAGEADLTAHVDFAMLLKAARDEGLETQGMSGHGDYLTRLGMAARAEALVRSAPERADEIRAAHKRLVDAREMGELFKVIAVRAAGWPALEGFA